jgi:preprotein translocase subunit SecD
MGRLHFLAATLCAAWLIATSTMVVSHAADLQIDVTFRAGQQAKLVSLKVVHWARIAVAGHNAIEISFDAASAKKLRQLTKAAIGKRVSFFVGNRELARLRMRAAITGPKAQLTGSFDSEFIKGLLRSSPRTVDLRIEK